MTETAIIEKVKEKYGYQVSPFSMDKDIGCFASSDIIFYHYYPKLKILIMPSRASADGASFDLLENLPDSFVDPFIYVEDRAKFIALHQRIDRGEAYVRDVIRLADGTFWFLMTLKVIKWDETGAAEVVIGLSEDISDIMNANLAKQEELRAANASLKSAFEASSHASTANYKFISSLSHDIRTPMNTIIGMAALAESNIDDRSRVLDCLTKVTASSKQLLGLINEVLDISKIATGKFALIPDKLNLPELIDDVISTILIRTEQHHQSLHVSSFDLTHENVIGDRQRLRQVLLSILSTSVTYTPDGGNISLSITEAPSPCKNKSFYTITVTDDGVGMSHALIAKAADIRQRTPANRQDDTPNAGMTISIANDIAKLMSGSIKVEESHANGSTYIVTIKLETAEAEASFDGMFFASLAGRSVLVADSNEASRRSSVEVITSLGMNCESVSTLDDATELVVSRHLRQEDFFAVILSREIPGMNVTEAIRNIRRSIGSAVPIVISSVYDSPDMVTQIRSAGAAAFILKPFFRSRILHLFKDLLNGQQANESPLSMLHALEHDDFCGKRALVVEDNELNAEIAGEVLSMAGLEVEYARDGRQALQMVQEAPSEYYDIIFMDIQMPVMNGYEATAAIRSLPLGASRRIPIIAMTANAFAEDVQASRQAGMNEHIAKPLDFTRLHELLVKYLG